MPVTRRTIADSLAEDAHDLLAGQDPLQTINVMEFRIQDLQELSDNEISAQEKTEKKKRPDTVDA